MIKRSVHQEDLTILMKLQNIKEKMIEGRPGGTAVKCACSTLAARGLPVWIPGVNMALLGMPCCGKRPTYNVEEAGHRC